MVGRKNPVLMDKQSTSRRGGSFRYGSYRLDLGSCLRACSVLLFTFLTAFGIGCKKEVKVVIPDVSHQDFAQAQQMLSAVPLKVGNITGVTGTPPRGTYVVSTSPAAGQTVAANYVIDLVVQVPVIVPPVTGLAVSDAV